MDDQLSKTVFFDRASLNQRKPKPKPIVYQIYICSRCNPSTLISTCEVGAWCALIVQRPQSNLDMNTQTTYMISGVEESDSHIRIRLNGIKEALEWITVNVPPDQYSSVEVTLISSDVFAVNTLREWLPKWSIGDFKMGTKAEREDSSIEHEKRPNTDILTAIARISTNINLTVKWEVETSPHMNSLSERLDELLSTYVVKETEKAIQQCKQI